MLTKNRRPFANSGSGRGHTDQRVTPKDRADHFMEPRQKPFFDISTRSRVILKKLSKSVASRCLLGVCRFKFKLIISFKLTFF